MPKKLKKSKKLKNFKIVDTSQEAAVAQVPNQNQKSKCKPPLLQQVMTATHLYQQKRKKKLDQVIPEAHSS